MRRGRGTTKLTLRAKSNHEVRGQCTITWKSYIHSIKLTGPEQMAAGSQAKTQVVKDVESDEALRYTSSAPDILEVSQDGELTAKKAGEAVITVTAGYGGASGSISVRVSEPEEKDIFNIRLTLDRDVLREGRSADTRFWWSRSTPPAPGPSHRPIPGCWRFWMVGK